LLPKRNIQIIQIHQILSDVDRVYTLIVLINPAKAVQTLYVVKHSIGLHRLAIASTHIHNQYQQSTSSDTGPFWAINGRKVTLLDRPILTSCTSTALWQRSFRPILWMGQRIPAPPKGWLNPMNNGMFTIYQLVQDFATIHSITRFVHVLHGVHQYSMHLLVTKLRPRINPCQDGSVSKQETPTSPTVTRINYPIVTFPLGGMPTFSHAHVTCWELYRLVHAHDYYSICSYYTICSFP